MYTLSVEMGFTAQHQLKLNGNSQEPLHEHEWQVCLSVSSDRLDSNELVMDFEYLKSLLDKKLQEFRGKRLESLGIFEHRNVSAETLARTIYQDLAPKLPDSVRLDAVEITEAPGCKARYSP